MHSRANEILICIMRFFNRLRTGYTYNGFQHVNIYQTWDYSAGLNNDLWKFDTSLATWSIVTNSTSHPTSPPARAFHAASFNAGVLYIHGGNDVMYGNNRRGGSTLMKLCGNGDLWKYTVSTDTWESIETYDRVCKGISASTRPYITPGVFLSVLIIALWLVR